MKVVTKMQWKVWQGQGDIYTMTSYTYGQAYPQDFQPHMKYNFLVSEKLCVFGETLVPEVKDFTTFIINTLMGKAEYRKILFI